MLVDFTIKGTYISHEEEDPEIAVSGLSADILIGTGQINGLDLQVGNTHWSFDYSDHGLHIAR